MTLENPLRSPAWALGLCALLSPWLTTPASAQSMVDPGEEEGAGIPHIVIGADNGAVVIEEFDAVEPSPEADLSVLFPQFAPVLTDSIPTVVVAVGAQLDADDQPIAVGTEDGIPGGTLSTFEFISSPVSGSDSGFINDDNGFESAGGEEGTPSIPDTSNITIDLSVPTGAETANSPFFIALASSLFTNIGDPIIGALEPPGFEIIEDGEVVDVINGDILESVFTLGNEFDTHPLFGLSLSEADEVGAALVEATVFDDGGTLTGAPTFRFLITNDTAAFQLVPEPTTAGLLGLGALLVLRRRRSINA